MADREARMEAELVSPFETECRWCGTKTPAGQPTVPCQNAPCVPGLAKFFNWASKTVRRG